MTATIKTTVIKEATSATDNITLDSSGNVTIGADAVITGKIGAGGTNYGTSGQVLTSGGSGAAPSWQDAAGGGFTEVYENVFASSGTFTPNADGKYYEIVVIGGGGKGNNSVANTGSATSNQGYGGGGIILSATKAQVGSSAITVTIAGSAGTSSFGNYATANGGSANAGGTASANIGTANYTHTGNAPSNSAGGYSIPMYSSPVASAWCYGAGTLQAGPTGGVGAGGGQGVAVAAANASRTASAGNGGPGLVIVKEYI